jgi:hypothetical protein
LYELYSERKKGPLPFYSDKKIENFLKGSKIFDVLYKSPEMAISLAKHEQSNTSPAGCAAVLAEQVNELDSLLDSIMKPAEKQAVAEKLGGISSSLKSLQKRLEANDLKVVTIRDTVPQPAFRPERDRRYSQSKVLSPGMSNSIIYEPQ